MTPRGRRTQPDLILHCDNRGAVRMIERSLVADGDNGPGSLVVVVYIRVNAAQDLLVKYLVVAFERH